MQTNESNRHNRITAVPGAQLTPGSSIGEVIAGRYRLDQELGRGGSGTVYRAFDIQHDRPVAIKLVARKARMQDLTRFKREFRAAARLRHHNCVTVYDLGEHRNNWYISMEYLDGGDLTHWQWATHEQLVAVTLQILTALDHIHAKQIIHRDIKPQNVLLVGNVDAAKTPHVKLSDFGIAKVGDVDEQLAVGTTLGSLAYIAPEQLEEGSADPRSDLYSLGVMLYEQLARRSPFEELMKTSSLVEWIARRRSWRVEDLRKVAPTVPEILAKAVMSLLEVNPDKRPATAAMVYDDLATWLHQQALHLEVARAELQRAAYLAAPRFVGRDVEVQQVRQFLQDVFAPPADKTAPVLMCVAGQAGLGKSRLAGQVIRIAEASGALVEIGTCRAEAGAPYDALAPLLQALGGASSKAPIEVDGDAGTMVESSPEESSYDQAVRTLMGRTMSSELGRQMASLDESNAGARWALYRQVADTLIKVALQKPCLLLLEDAQWADGPTLQLLEFLVRAVATARQGGQKVMAAFFLTHRHAEEHTALASLYEMGRENDTLVRITLAPLPNDAAVELVASMLAMDAGPEVARVTTELSQGSDTNPLFLAQSLRLLLARGLLRRQGTVWNLAEIRASDSNLPRTIAQAIGDRAARMGAQTKEALAAASVLGRRFSLALLSTVMGEEELSLLDNLDEAVRAGFISERHGEDGMYIFEHDRFRESIYDLLSGDERRRLHRTAATAIEASSDGAKEEIAVSLCHHYAACGVHDKAYRFGVVAGRHALQGCAYDGAAATFKVALDAARAGNIEVKPEVLEAYGDACMMAGRYDPATEAYQQRLTHAHNTVERINVLRKIGRLEYGRGHNEAAQTALLEALKLAGAPAPTNNATLVVGMLRNFMLSIWLTGPRRVRHAKAAGDQAILQELICDVSHFLIKVYFFTAYLRTAFFAFQAVFYAARVGPSPISGMALSTGAYLFGSIGLKGIAARMFKLSEAWLQGHQPELGWRGTMMSMTELFYGQPRAALEAGRSAEAILMKARVPETLRSAQEFHAEAAMMLGKTHFAMSKAQELWQLCEDVNDNEGRGWAKYLLGHGHARLGNASEAMSQLRQAVTFAGMAGDHSYGTVASARLYLEMALAGESAAALTGALADSQNYHGRMLRTPTCTIDGALMIAAAMHLKQHGHVPAGTRGAIYKARFVTSYDHAMFKSAMPMYEAGLAAWRIARGKLSDGKAGFARALTRCDAAGMLGEAYDVTRLAMAFLPQNDPERSRYAARHEEVALQLRTMEE